MTKLKALLYSSYVTAFTFACILPAYAAVDPATITHTLPVGAWLSDLLKILAPAIVALASWAFSKYVPSTYRAFIGDKVVSQAVNFVLATVERDVASQTIPTAQLGATVNATIEYIISNEPKIAKYLGDNLEPLIIAELQKSGVVPPDAKAEHFKRAA